MFYSIANEISVEGLPDLRGFKNSTQNKRFVLKFAIMTVTLELEPEVESRLAEKAKNNGFDVNAYVKKLIEKDVNREPTIDEILAPFRKSVEESGMTDDELDALFTEARKEVYKAKKERQKT